MKTLLARVILAFVLSAVGLTSLPAGAAGLPVALESALFRTILMDTPEGMELASRLLGRPLVDVTETEADQALESLRASHNRALVEDLAARVEEIDASVKDAPRKFRGETDRIMFIQEVTVREIPIDASVDESVLSFQDGESHLIRGNFAEARGQFMAPATDEGASPTTLARKSAAQLTRARSKLDAAAAGVDHQALIVRTFEASNQAVRDLEAALASVSPTDSDGNYAPVSAAQKRGLQKLAAQIDQPGLAQRLGGRLSPASRNRHARIIAEYVASQKKLGQLVGTIEFLRVR